MKSRPTIFLSGVSHEFGSFRDAVQGEILMKGCYPHNQPGFPPDYRTVEEMLRRKLHEADAVIHIVGFRFGAEPNELPAGNPRRSYTQMEFDIAREMQKPVYVFLSATATVRQPPDPKEQPEDAGAEALQLAHRKAVQSTNQLYYFFRGTAELCRLVAEIPIVAQASEFKPDISRIIKYAPAELIGREDELKLLNDAWLKVRRADSPRPHILTFVALGGEGKTSLVAKWVAELAHQDWPGCDAAFAWSFYSQGTREQMAASSDLFLKEALTFFGDDADKEFAASPAGAFEKGQHLARIVGQRRSLLILDGLEPLQYAPTSPTPGQLKDQGIAALLKGLAAASHGLCVVTTRYSLPDLKAFWQATAPEVPLLRLSRDAGVHLLKTLGVRGTAQEFETLVEDVKGHALTLTLLGGFLQRAFHGDIRQRDRVKFEKADEKMDGGHAFRTMAAYEQWLLRDGGDEGRREVAVLRLMGLFDRPADAGCLAALRSETIPGLTEPLAGLADDDWEYCLSGLEAAKLLTVNRDAAGALVSLDAHPHLREYFARQLRTQQPDAWRAAHRRLYEHLCAAAPECTKFDEQDAMMRQLGIRSDKPQPTLEDLQSLYQAVAHGCQAELFTDALKVYKLRVKRERQNFATAKLGAFSSDLGALACFFDVPWHQTKGRLTEKVRAEVGDWSGFRLMACGRLAEAQAMMTLAMPLYVAGSDWRNAASVARNLSEACLTLGEIEKAGSTAQHGIDFAMKIMEPTDPFIMAALASRRAQSLHQLGDRLTSKAFDEAERRWRDYGQGPAQAFSFSHHGFHYYDFLLDGNEFERVLQLTRERLDRKEESPPLLSRALEHLAHGRAQIGYAVTNGLQPPTSTQKILNDAVNWTRRSNRQDYLPKALLTRAWLRFLTGARTGPESAQEDLDEAWEIAERGPMKLFLADIHLHRARLFGTRNAEFGVRNEEYPWESPAADLAAAEKLINDCGYHRRDEELADAKQAILAS